MIVNKYSLQFLIVVFIFSLIFILPVSLLVSIRELGTDTENYKYSFYLFKEYSYISNEPGIYFFAWLSLLLGGDIELYFWFLFVSLIVFINISYYKAFKSLFNLEELCFFYFAFLGMYFFSTWFQVVSLSVLRHGLALLILYYSLFLLIKGEVLRFFIFFVLSLFFHVSIILILPFILLLKLSEKKFYIVFFSLAIFYPLGVNEYFISTFSNLTGVPIYELISSYSKEDVRYFGFNYLYYSYTIFWSCFGLYIQKKVIDKSQYTVFSNVVKIYSCLAMVLFVFGFASFSNRYGLFSWLFIPFMQIVIFGVLFNKSLLRYFASIVIFITGFLYYIDNFYDLNVF